MTVLYEDLEMEAWDMEDFEDFDYELDFEEAIKPAPKEVVKAAKIAAKAGGGVKAAKKVEKVIRNPVAAKEFEFETDFEGDFEAEFEAAGGDMELLAEVSALAEMVGEAESEEEADYFWGALASAALPLLGNVVSSFLNESDGEFDGELEFDWESDWEYGDGEDADQFWGAIAGLAAPLIKKAIPIIGKGVKALGRFAMGRGKRFLKRTAKALPAMMANTGRSLARQAMSGRPMNVSNIASTFGGQVLNTMGSRRNYARAMQMNRRLGRYGFGRYPQRRRRRRRRYRGYGYPSASYGRSRYYPQRQRYGGYYR